MCQMRTISLGRTRAARLALLPRVSSPRAERLARAAFALEDARQGEVLPLFRRGAAAESFEGYRPQLERLEREAGVRQQALGASVKAARFTSCTRGDFSFRMATATATASG